MLPRIDLAKLAKLHGQDPLLGRLNPSQSDGLKFLVQSLALDPLVIGGHQAAYILATAKWETGHTYQPIAEWPSPSDPRFTKYDPGKHPDAIRMGNTKPGDGHRYRGRGYVQLTWQKNYERMGKLLDVDLLERPDRALEPEIACQILVRGMVEGLFTGHRLDKYVGTGPAPDYLQARMVVNPGELQVEKLRPKAQQIAAIARALSSALTASVL